MARACAEGWYETLKKAYRQYVDSKDEKEREQICDDIRGQVLGIFTHCVEGVPLGEKLEVDRVTVTLATGCPCVRVVYEEGAAWIEHADCGPWQRFTCSDPAYDEVLAWLGEILGFLEVVAYSPYVEYAFNIQC